MTDYKEDLSVKAKQVFAAHIASRMSSIKRLKSYWSQIEDHSKCSALREKIHTTVYKMLEDIVQIVDPEMLQGTQALHARLKDSKTQKPSWVEWGYVLSCMGLIKDHRTTDLRCFIQRYHRAL